MWGGWGTGVGVYGGCSVITARRTERGARFLIISGAAAAHGRRTAEINKSGQRVASASRQQQQQQQRQRQQQRLLGGWERKRGGEPGSCAGLFDAQGWKIRSRCPQDLRGSACWWWRLFYSQWTAREPGSPAVPHHVYVPKITRCARGQD